MAASSRITLINKAKTRAGRKAQNINLVNAFDGILQYMTAKYPLISHQRFSAASVGSQAYLAFNLTGDTPAGAMASHAHNIAGTSTPSKLIRAVEKIQYNAQDTEYLEPELFFTFYSASTGTPTKTTFVRNGINSPVYSASPYIGNSVWMYLTPSGTSVCMVYCSLIHPKSDSISGNVGDAHVHYLSEDMDEAIHLGVTWKALEIVGNFQEAARTKILFEQELENKAMEKIKGSATVHHPEL